MENETLRNVINVARANDKVKQIIEISLNREQIPISLAEKGMSVSRNVAIRAAKAVERTGMAKLKIGRRGAETRLIFTCEEEFKTIALENIQHAITLDKAKVIYMNVISEASWPYTGYKSLKEAVIATLVRELVISDDTALVCFSKLDSENIESEQTSYGLPPSADRDLAASIQVHIEMLKRLTSAKQVSLIF
jgi:hypothetical protein